MASVKKWALTSDIEVILTITPTGKAPLKYRVAQVSGYNAANELPQANCLLAIGNAPLGDKLNSLLTTAGQLSAMYPAILTLSLKGDYDNKGKVWPEQVVTLFDGYFAGASYRKMNGQVYAAVQLVHWLAALSFTSALSQYAHPSGASDLAFSQTQLTAESGAAAAKPFLVGQMGPAFMSQSDLQTDVWGTLKDFFYNYAGSAPMNFRGDFGATALNPGTAKNDIAKTALARIEGGGLGINANSPGKKSIVYGAPEITQVSPALRYRQLQHPVTNW